jgi:adenosylcobinamide-phosphate synthase
MGSAACGSGRFPLSDELKIRVNRGALLPAAWLFDRLAGDPEWLPHPVRLMGAAITRGEAAVRRPGQSRRAELVAGAALTCAIVGVSWYATRRLLVAARRTSPMLGRTAELLLAWSCLAARNLEQEAAAVIDALESGDLPHARHRLARIVGRDTAQLSETEICRATIETLAESACDGIVAPLLSIALGGVPLAMAYKAINTLDSMIGHADARYYYFGKAAARLDDAANYLPARVTALLLVAAAATHDSAGARSAWRTWRRDGRNHKSPNAGQPESTMAGALRVRLGGDNTYAGEVVHTPLIGREYGPPSVAHTRTALRLVSHATIFGVAYATLLSIALPAKQIGSAS